MSSPTLRWGEAAVCPLFTPPRFRDPSFHRGDQSSALLSPAPSLPAVASLPLGLSLLFPKGSPAGHPVILGLSVTWVQGWGKCRKGPQAWASHASC